MFEGIGRVLIISANEKGTEYIEKEIRQFEPETVVCMRSASEARRALSDGCAFDYVFVNMPLTDETGADLARKISEAGASVMALVRAETAEQVGISFAESGIFTLSKPVVRTAFLSGVYNMTAMRARIAAKEAEIEKLRAQMREAALVSRAKCLLIEKTGITEAQAHRHIEKRAMDLRKSRREVAQDIIEMYDE